MASWVEATKAAIMRHVTETGSVVFTRQSLLNAEILAIIDETGTTGSTPSQTLGRELQQLRDAGFVEFLERGSYRWLGAVPAQEPVVPSKAIFVLERSADNRPEQDYAFPPQFLKTARQAIGQWIIYQDDDGYRAAARVERITTARDAASRFHAHIAPESYLEFGRVVSLRHGGEIVERGLVDPSGTLNVDLARRPVRIIAQEDFDRIVDLGLVSDEDLLPRSDGEAETFVPQHVSEERVPWDAPIDRATVLINRKVRDRQFRKRVLDVYGGRCALTGMMLKNGGGRLETEAAHIMSVEAGGPDAVNNGIALSGTVHWMFDRGLISLEDDGEILLSSAINDREGVERLINRDRRAWFPPSPADRPHPEYLRWHRKGPFEKHGYAR